MVSRSLFVGGGVVAHFIRHHPSPTLTRSKSLSTRISRLADGTLSLESNDDGIPSRHGVSASHIELASRPELNPTRGRI